MSNLFFSKNNIPGNTSETGYNRRRFLNDASKGLFAASLLGGIGSLHAAGNPPEPQQGLQANLADTIPVHLKPLNDPSEKKEPPPPAPLDPSKKLGFAIVGLGHLALSQILPAFGSSKFAKPVALVSGDEAKAAQVAAQYGIDPKNIYDYKNFDNIKDNPAIDVVYIVLPNSMHEEFVVRAAKAGKHVLCEKPMATSSKEAERMIAACEQANRKLMVAYRIQYEPRNRKMMEWTRSHQYGKVKLIETYNGQHIGDPSQWRLHKALSGGGSMPDIGLYCLNTCRFLTGEEPEWVLASTFSTPNDIRFKEVEETVLFQMRFPSGTLANCSTSYGAHESRRYRCLADKGGWFGMDPAFAYTGLQMQVDEAKDKMDWNDKPLIEEKDQFALEMDHMAECVMYNKRPYTPGEEGLQDHKIMEAIYKSASDGKPVQLEKITKTDAFRGTPPAEVS